MTLGDNSLEIMLHPFNIHFFLSRPKIHYCSCDLGHRRPFPTITNLKSPPGKSFTPSMNIAPDQTIILGIQIFLDHRSLSLIDQTNLNDTGRVIIGHRYSKSTFGANKSTNRN